MRVPTYQSQTELTGNVPGQRFTVSANPGALSQTAKAFSGLGAQIQKEGTDFYNRLLSEQRDTELKQAQMDYKEELGSLKLASLSASPSVITGDGPKGFEALAAKLQTKINNGLTDSVVQKRFKLAAADATTNAYITVKQQARNRQIDAAAATKLRYAETLEKQAVYGNATERNEALNELYGPVNKKTGLRDGVSFYKRMAGGGLITQSAGFQYEQKSRQTIDRYNIEAAIISADNVGTDSPLTAEYQAGLLVQELMDPKNYPDLDPMTRLAYQQKAINLEQAYATKVIAAAEKANSSGTAAATALRKKNEGVMLAKLFTYQEEGSRTAKPSIDDVITAVDNGDISTEFAKFAFNALNSTDAPADNQSIVSDFTNSIVTATTTEQLDNLRDQIIGQGGENGTVTLDTQESLLRFINQQESNTTEAKAIKEYKKQLSSLTLGGRSENMFASLDDPSMNRHIDTHLTFFELVNDALNPMAPKDAFNTVKEQFLAAKNLELPFLTGSPIIQDAFPSILGAEEGMARADFFNALTPQMIQTAKNKLNQDITLTRIQKTFDNETIDLLVREKARFDAEQASYQ